MRFYKNKSLITNIITIFVIILGYSLNIGVLFNAGIFAFSGAITNWIAVYMLFEKVPFLYGSGVIPRNFAEFKMALNHLY